MRDETRKLGSWFLGPKSENAQLFEEMILYVLRDYLHWRRNYFPSDEILLTHGLRREAQEAGDTLYQNLSEMQARLKRHFPFFNPRYIAHMLSDQTMASMLGYFAGMLYNPNNVTPEAAPVTVEWELEVSAQILKLLGYRTSGARKQETGWAHLTGGGTVATIEALWVARNVRQFPLAVREAARRHGLAIHVKTPVGELRDITSLTPLQCATLKPNEAVYLLPRYLEAAGPDGWAWIDEAHAARNEAPPAIFVSGAAHYSVAKAADILGLGRNQLIYVDLDRNFRCSVPDLEEKLRLALDRGLAPLAVVAVTGTTEEGAVDPVHRIVEARERLEAELGSSFWLHADAAWGGYLRTLFVTAQGESTDLAEVNRFVSRRLELVSGSYRKRIQLQWGASEVLKSFAALPSAESVTIDPHKMGYVPYPCGAVAFRNGRVKQFIGHEAPYITASSPRDQERPPATVGPFILEGSKPGAAAAALWLSHRIIPPSREGYGEIMRASLLAARELYERLAHFDIAAKANHHEPGFRFFPVAAAPPDTNMVCFVVNANGNTSLEQMNRLNERIYSRFTIQAELGEREYSYAQPFFLSRTRFHEPHYTARAVAELLERAGVDQAAYAREGIFVLRATVMSPYLTMAAETDHKQALLAEFVDRLAREIPSCIQ